MCIRDSLKSDDEKKKFFKAVDAKHDAKNEELDEMKHEMAHEMMKKEMMKKVEMLKAEKDPKKMEMMRKEMMKEMDKMPEMMKKEMMKKMEIAMKEAEVPAEPMKKLNTGEKMKEEALPQSLIAFELDRRWFFGTLLDALSTTAYVP